MLLVLSLCFRPQNKLWKLYFKCHGIVQFFLKKSLPKVHMNNCIKLFIMKVKLTVNYNKGEGFLNVIQGFNA